MTARYDDRFAPAYTTFVVATKARDRYWDGDAVRVPVTDAEWKKAGQTSGESYQGTAADWNGYAHTRVREPNPAGAPLLDWWACTADRATERFLLSMCPLRVCRVCGMPSRRIVEAQQFVERPDGSRVPKRAWAAGPSPQRAVDSEDGAYRDQGLRRIAETLGWSDCGHDDYRAGVVLDCFAGSGTTLAVASGHGLDSIGVDIDSRNADLALERVGGLFLEVEYLAAEVSR